MMSVFKAYDIRGIVPDQLNPTLAYQIGVGTASFIGGGQIVVGQDARTHSPEISAALVQGLVDAGATVLDIGLVSTPMVYYAVDAQGAAGGVMVTASHNPGQYNGFKICREHAIPIGEESGLKEIEQIALATDAGALGQHDQEASVQSMDVLAGYTEHVLAVGGALPARRVKIAIDCGNGMAGVPLAPILEAWEAQGRIEVSRLYFEPDGSFPNHEADPLKLENLREVAEAVVRDGADFGVAFDGDGDRAVFVDNQGEPVSSDLMTALLARYQLKNHPNGLVLYDLRSSRAVAQEVEAAGGRAQMCRVGHSFVKAQMRESGAVFAGELSGHFYFRFSDSLMVDDAVAAFVAVLDVLAGEEGSSMADLVRPLRRYHASGEINREVEGIDELLNQLESEHAGANEISRMDGLYVSYPTWWFNLRPSNTEPVLRLNLEADTQEKMESERDALLARMVSS
ncbi:MAG: phosphomannomutase [Gammaproteobacteria bacterium]